MRTIAVFLTVWLAFALASPVVVPLKAVRSTSSDMVSAVGSVQQCVGGVHYELQYNTTGFTGESITDLEGVRGLRGVDCNIDDTQLKLIFDNKLNMDIFIARVKLITDFVVVHAGSHFKCAVNNDDGFLLRRIIGLSHHGSEVYLHTQIAKYDELYSEATISYRSLTSPCPNVSAPHHPICIGMNTEQDCTSATKPITIYQNSLLSLTCPNCFLGFSTNLFFTIRIEKFKLVDITAGFKNMSVHGNLVFDFKVEKDWTMNVHKTLNFIPPQKLFSFRIGPIPFSFSFALPVDVSATAHFSASAEMRAGVTLVGNLGDNYNEWRSGSGWKHVKPTPSWKHTPVVSGQWDFSGDASLSIAPTLSLQLSRLYEYDLSFTPKLDLVAYADHNPPKLCANLTSETTLEAKSQLNINIPWLDIHSHKTWGPTVIFDSGVKHLGSACARVAGDGGGLGLLRLPPVAFDAAPSSADASAEKAPPSSSSLYPTGEFSWGMGKALAMMPRAAPNVEEEGTLEECHEGLLFRTTYRTKGYGGEAIINLDQVKGLDKLQCDLDETSLMLTFHDSSSSAAFVNSVNSAATFLTGGGKWGCNITKSGGGFLLRRILGGEVLGLQVMLRTIPAKYDEIYDEADIQYSSVGACPNSTLGGKHAVCIGVNTEKDCATPKKALPLVSGKFISITCSDCFLGFKTDIFISLKIHGFKMITLSGGFKNMALNGALVLDMKAEAVWNAGIDKTFKLVPPVTLFDFKIGRVPFSFSFDVPVEVTATASFDAVAEATAGATLSGALGDNYVSYTAGKGWSHIKSAPKFSWKPQVTGRQSFNAEATFAMVPTMQVKLSNIYEYDLKYTPTLDLKAYEQKSPKPAVCANVTARDTLTASSDLNINIPWLDIHSHDTWGPTVIFDSGKINCGHACIHL